MSAWVVKAHEESITCSCPVGCKRRVCKHTLAVGVWSGRVELADLASHHMIGQKRKRGHPAATARCAHLDIVDDVDIAIGFAPVWVAKRRFVCICQ